MAKLGYFVVAVFLALSQQPRIRAEELDELTPDEERRIKSLILNEGDAATITCPRGEVIRIKTSQYRITDRKVCGKDATTCRNSCPGAFRTEELAQKCDMNTSCRIKARNSRDKCANRRWQPLATLYTCNNKRQAKEERKPDVHYMRVLQSGICNIGQLKKFCRF